MREWLVSTVVWNKIEHDLVILCCSYSGFNRILLGCQFGKGKNVSLEHYFAISQLSHGCHCNLVRECQARSSRLSWLYQSVTSQVRSDDHNVITLQPGFSPAHWDECLSGTEWWLRQLIVYWWEHFFLVLFLYLSIVTEYKLDRECRYRFSASCCSQGFLLHFEWGVLPELQCDDQHVNIHVFSTYKAVWWMLISTFKVLFV